MTGSPMRRARFLVIEALYESETSDHDPEAVYSRLLEELADEDAWRFPRPAPRVSGVAPSEECAVDSRRSIVSCRMRHHCIHWRLWLSLTATF